MVLAERTNATEFTVTASTATRSNIIAAITIRLRTTAAAAKCANKRHFAHYNR